MPTVPLAAYYDFRVAPLTFDFAVFLAIVCAHADQKSLDLIDLKLIAPYFRRLNKVEASYPDGYAEHKLHNVIVKLAMMVSRIRNISVIKGGDLSLERVRFPESYHPQQVDLTSGLTQIPCNFVHLRKFTASGWVPNIFHASAIATSVIERLCGSIDVCLTLRTTPFKRNRDCSLDDWHRLYSHLVRHGLRVVVIPDHDDVVGDQRYKSYEWDSIPQCALDLDLRLAAYRAAKVNIAWASGTNTLLYLTDVCFLIFGNLDERDPTSNADIYRRKVIEPGEQPDWFIKGRQVWDWQDAKDTTSEYMISKVEAMLVRQGF